MKRMTGLFTLVLKIKKRVKIFEHVISLSHGGRNSQLLDLIISLDNVFLFVILADRAEKTQI